MVSMGSGKELIWC